MRTELIFNAYDKEKNFKCYSNINMECKKKKNNQF